MEKPVFEIVRERTAYHQKRGIVGTALYEALAIDTEIPDFLSVDDSCAITGDSQTGLKQRRQRGQEPPFVRLSGRRVVYPKGDLFFWLARRYVAGKPRKAAANIPAPA